MNYLTSMNNHPEKAKYILPAYLMGVASYLHFLWFHFIISIDDGDMITPNLLTAYANKVRRCLAGLNRIKQDLDDSVASKITSTKLTVNPELGQLREALFASEVGLGNMDYLYATIKNVELIEQSIEKDIALVKANQPAQYYFKQTTWKL